mmetsp:Transcript_2968/g.8901  ORF Transcript_2968/g.8901 Transcript_2968/m.8901 type:complete len:202 (+) Transcript_2968:2133-2738(+)
MPSSLRSAMRSSLPSFVPSGASNSMAPCLPQSIKRESGFEARDPLANWHSSSMAGAARIGKLAPRVTSVADKPGFSRLMRISLACGNFDKIPSNSLRTVGTVRPQPTSRQVTRKLSLSDLASNCLSQASYLPNCAARLAFEKPASPPNICTFGRAMALHFGHVGKTPATRCVGRAVKPKSFGAFQTSGQHGFEHCSHRTAP